jgi:uncharacterized protein (DUF885 family)
MRRMARALGLLLLSLSASAAEFPKLVERYYQQWAALRPVDATAIGWHEHDAEVDDVSQAATEKTIAWLHGWQKELSQPMQLSAAEELDRQALALSVESQLVSLETIGWWRRRPDRYADLASESVYVIMKRAFAPEAERLKLVIARERRVPGLLAEARKNLTQASRISVEIALMQIPDIIDFFDKDVPSAFPSVKDPELLKQLAGAGAAAQKALADYGEWLKKDLLPRAKADFAIGEDAFRKKLHADELVDTPLDALLQRGDAELRRLQQEFRNTASKIDAKKPFAVVQAEMQREHPTPERIIPDTQARLAGLRKFLVDKKIVSLPSEVLPRVKETPPFMRATTFASMDTPGPFETRSTEAYYNVTLPEKSWPAAQVEDYLAGAFNRPLIDVVSIHEAFPGHYVQFIWIPKLQSKVRKIETANSNVEGWAHYCEQMLLDEGYGGGDARLRLAQLQDALLRAARYVAGIRMHTRGMSFAGAVEFFQKEGYQSKKVAEMEARRGTGDPTYLIYTLGKLEILKLRDDYQRKLGASYSLQKFHDAFLAEGALPLPLVRKAMLGDTPKN